MASQSTWNPVDGIQNYDTIAAVPALANTQDATSAQQTNPVNQVTTTNANAQTREVGANELVSNQVNNIIAEDSPLMQQAKTMAKQQANARGLLNSSMAAGAAQNAVIGAALPMAQQDAATFSNVATGNLNNQQQAELTNTAASNSAASQNAQAQNQVDAQNLANQQQTNLTNAAEANKVNIVNASETNKILAQMMDQENRKQLADIEASYKVLMQADASAMSTYQSVVKNISEILMNPDLSPEAKTAAVNNQNQLLQTGMQLIGKMNGLNLDDLLTFPTV